MDREKCVCAVCPESCSVVVAIDVLMNCILLQSNFLKPYSLYIDKLIILIRIFFITLLRTDIALVACVAGVERGR